MVLYIAHSLLALHECAVGKATSNQAILLCLQERLAAFETEQPNGMTEAADDVSSFEWRGAHYPVSAETISAALAPVAAAERELSADPASISGVSGSSDARLVKLDRLGNAYAGALAAVQSAIANGAPFAIPTVTCGGFCYCTSVI